MTLVDRYFASRIISALFRAVLATAFLFIFIDLATHRRREILENDVPALVVAEYYVMLLPSILRDFQVGAVAILVSNLLVFGRAAQDQEITALLASGVGLYRYIRVPALIGLLFALAIFGIAETFGVTAAERVAEIESRVFDDDRGSVLEPVSWANLNGGWTCHIFGFDRTTMAGEDVLLLNLGDSRVQQIEAERMQWDEGRSRWMLEGGIWSTFYPEEGMEIETRRIDFEPAPIEEDPKALFLGDKDSGTKTLGQLREEIATAKHRHVPTQRTEVDYHNRFALPTLTFIMMWIALPFALRSGRGGLAFSLAGSAGIGLAYFVVYAGSIGLGNIGRIEPWLAAWLANILFGGAAAIMMYRTTT